MKLNPLVIVLIAAGVFSSGYANAVDVSPTGHGKSIATANIEPITAPNYAAIVERFGPAVVGINTEVSEKNNAKDGEQRTSNDPLFRFFHGQPDAAPRSPDASVRGLASGFIISKDGLILTNAHVVRNTDEVIVKLSDQREFKAKVLGSDNYSDIAVLKIKAENLPIVNLGNSDQLRVGDYVLAIGSPFGFEQSATAGIVSAKGRALPGDGNVPFIQTDAAVNPGNSGGPLFNAGGAVIGITSQIYSETGGYQGLSFAIPINVALRIKDQILASGKAVHARLGVSVQEVDQSLADSFRLKLPGGALVSSVAADSPAEKAGIEVGDIILKFNDKVIRKFSDLPLLVETEKPADKAAIEIWRSGKVIQLGATLGEVKSDIVADNSSHSNVKLGVAVRSLTADEKKGNSRLSGLMVEDVSGPAARAGIESGDVIVAINGTQVKSVEDLQKIVATMNTRLAVLIQRGDAKIFIPVNLS